MPSEKRRWTWSELSLSPSPCPWRRQYRPCQFRRCKHRTTLSRTSGRHVVWVTRASLDAACATPLCAITGALSAVAHVDCVVSTADASADTARKRRGSSNGGVVVEIGDPPGFKIRAVPSENSTEGQGQPRRHHQGRQRSRPRVSRLVCGGTYSLR